MVVVKQQGNWKLETNKRFNKAGEQTEFWTLVHESTRTVSNTQQSITRDFLNIWAETDLEDLKAIFSE